MGVVTLTDAWPKPGEPFTVSDLDRMPDDGHREAAQVAGDEPFRADQPFPVEVVPARLVAKLRAR